MELFVRGEYLDTLGQQDALMLGIAGILDNPFVLLVMLKVTIREGELGDASGQLSMLHVPLLHSARFLHLSVRRETFRNR